MKSLLVPFISVGMLLFSNCSRESGAVPRTELMLFCGAGLRDVMEPLIDSFEVREPVTVQTSYDGSGKLLAQISVINQGDVFIPGEEFYMQKALEKGLVLKEPIDTVCYFIPVLFVQKGNPKAIYRLSDLTRAGLRVGLGDERATAVGKICADMLRRAGVDSAAIARTVVLRAGTVSELGAAVQLLTVDAVVVWESTARQFAKNGEIVPLPPSEIITSVVPAGVLATSKHRELAGRFVQYVSSDAAKKVLIAHHYSITLPESPAVK